jgi:hypothetical protein
VRWGGVLVHFPHDVSSDFADLVQIVADERGLTRSIIEKDYWVTHTLWAICASGFNVWFKGGTSLSKGFQLIERFSENLDLKLEAPEGLELPQVGNWNSAGTRAIGERRAYFEAIADSLIIPGCRVELDVDSPNALWRGASFRVRYPSLYPHELPREISGYILLEIGDARVTPALERDITSWVHARLDALGIESDYTPNRPKGLRCVHPLVTLLEKLDAIQRRFPSENHPAQTYVRHYEDATRLALAAERLPALDAYGSVRALALEMLSKRQLMALPSAADPSLNPAPDDRWTELQRAHDAIGPMFWGERTSLKEACRVLRDWIVGELE